VLSQRFAIAPPIGSEEGGLTVADLLVEAGMVCYRGNEKIRGGTPTTLDLT
jgi:hypothetical protein